MNDFGFGTQPVVDPLGEVDPLTGLRKPVGMPLPQRQQIEDEATKKALVQSLRNTKDWMGSQFSLDSPKNPSLTAVGADALISAFPGIGQATSARDVERARRDNDPVAGGLAATGLIPGAAAALGAKTALMAGVRALHAPKNLHMAEGAEQLGEDTWKHGWFRGKENHTPWKWEIDDSKAALKNLKAGQYDGKLVDLLDHPELYKNYPDLKDLYISGRIEPSMLKGHGEGSYMHSGKGMSAEAGTYEELRDTILHEIQHAIQAREGFNTGANTDAIAKALRDTRVVQGTVPSTADSALAWRLYNRNMGEVESRVVENRSLWTPEQRRAVNPLSQMGPEGSLYDTDRTIKSIVQHTAPKNTYKKTSSELYNSLVNQIE